MAYLIFLFQVDVYAGAIFIQQAIGWNTYLSIAVLLVVTGIYTIIGNSSCQSRGGGCGSRGRRGNLEKIGAGVCRWNFEYTPYSYNFLTNKIYLFI